LENIKTRSHNCYVPLRRRYNYKQLSNEISIPENTLFFFRRFNVCYFSRFKDRSIKIHTTLGCIIMNKKALFLNVVNNNRSVPIKYVNIITVIKYHEAQQYMINKLFYLNIYSFTVCN